MAEMIDEAGHIESTTVAIMRTAATVKGGRRMSFGALVVVGDRRGKVGYGHAKAKEVPVAIEKSQKYAKRSMDKYPLLGGTIPHEVTGRHLASTVRLIPASPGTGVIAGGTVRAVLELLGVTDCMTKSYGSNNKINLIKAVLDGLSQLRTREQIEELRGVTLGTSDIEERVIRSEKLVGKPAPVLSATPAGGGASDENESNDKPADGSTDQA